MEAAKRANEENGGDEDLGFMMWKLESIDKFYPCYRSLLDEE